jgi:hypothetical protein
MWNKWGYFLVGDEKRRNFAFTKQEQSVVHSDLDSYFLHSNNRLS